MKYSDVARPLKVNLERTARSGRARSQQEKKFASGVTDTEKSVSRERMLAKRLAGGVGRAVLVTKKSWVAADV